MHLKLRDMENNMNIQDKIDQTFNAIEAVEQVNVSPFFKDKTMQLLFAEKEEVAKVWNWFTPQLQLASLVCVLIINVYAIKQINTTKHNDSISSFASDYGLSTESKSSFLNL